MLCTVCKGVGQIDYSKWHNDEVPVDFERYDTLPDCPLLRSGVALGCPLCEMLLDEVHSRLSRIVGPTPFLLHSAKYTCESYFRSDVPLDINGVHCLEIKLTCEASGPERDTGLKFRVFSEKVPDEDIFREVPGGPPIDFGLLRRRLPDNKPTDENSVALMKRWIHECTTNHPKCRLDEEAFFPTRVLDVGESGKDPSIHLVTTNADISGDYVALSHCWGNPAHISISKTESNNLDERCAGFSIDSMSKNLRDAVVITRLLGIRYLWIDSLCIIQNSKADWETESARMDQVYKYSIVTLVATRADSCDDGFLQPRYGASRKKVRIPYSCKNVTETGGFYILQSHTRVKSIASQTDLDCSRWETRGWTLQERFLSRRLIHFSDNQIYLECGTAMYAEDNDQCMIVPLDRLNVCQNEESSCSPESTSVTEYEESTCSPTEFTEEEDDNTSSDDEPSVPKYPFDRPLNNLYERWFCLIGAYSPRNLTYESDKLPAISGVAKEMADFTGDRYLAGLWEGDLTQGLLWMSSEDDAKLSSQSQYRAPSWSWASLNGQITHTTHWSINKVTDWSAKYAVPVLHVRDAHIEVAGKDPCGSVASAFLRLSGRFMKVMLTGPFQRMASTTYTKVPSHFPFCIKIVKDERIVEVGVGHLDMRNMNLVPQDDIWCLQVEKQRPGVAEVEDPWCGLLLTQAMEESKMSDVDKTFRRIGVFVLYEDHIHLFDDHQERELVLV